MGFVPDGTKDDGTEHFFYPTIVLKEYPEMRSVQFRELRPDVHRDTIAELWRLIPMYVGTPVPDKMRKENQLPQRSFANAENYRFYHIRFGSFYGKRESAVDLEPSMARLYPFVYGIGNRSRKR